MEWEPDMSTIEYTVTGMTCGHCELSVREEVSGVPGVEDVEVSATTGTLIVTSTGPIDDAQVLNAVDEAGYSAVRVA
jgi:copper chaperone CopZ